MTKKLTLEDIILAYKETGLKPRLHRPDVENGACCPVGVLAIFYGKLSPFYINTNFLYEYCDSEYGVNFINALWKGFDGWEFNESITDVDYHDGYRLGRQVREYYQRLGVLEIW